jgi:bifunctional DNA primase/polymerase-like protein/uncharacterized protein DUF5906
MASDKRVGPHEVGQKGSGLPTGGADEAGVKNARESAPAASPGPNGATHVEPAPQTTKPLTRLDWALAYIDRGMAVFPCHTVKDGRCSCGKYPCGEDNKDAGKHTVYELAPHAMKNATKDPAKIREWWSKGDWNISVVTGQISGITVFDVDIADGKPGAESWRAACERTGHGEPQTLLSRTGSGGMHFFFKYNSAIKTTTNWLGKGVDTRNDKNGYVLVAPSRHRSGGTYSWLDKDGEPTDVMPDTPLEDVPAEFTQRVETRGRKKKDPFKDKIWSVEELAHMLSFVRNEDQARWFKVGIILGRVLNRSEEGWKLYSEWSENRELGYDGKHGRNHDKRMHEAYHVLSAKDDHPDPVNIGSLIEWAKQGDGKDHRWAPKTGGAIPIEDLIYLLDHNKYVYRPTGSEWVAEAVNAACCGVNLDGQPVKPADWLKLKMYASSIANDPAIRTDYLRDFNCGRDGVPYPAPGAALFNQYRAPTIEPGGDPALAGPLEDHVRKVFPKPAEGRWSSDADQFLDYLSHRVQHPEEKPRFALMLSGEQGVGKDTCVDMCLSAIGSWNVANIAPKDLDSGFNEYAAAVLVRINEAADLHEMSKWAFSNSIKNLIAGGPDDVTINPKYGVKYHCRMHCGVIVTTNHALTGVYIPPDDRRYDVLQAATKADMGLEDEEKHKEYFSRLWKWYHNGGAKHVAAYLRARNLSKFSAAQGQRKTAAHQAVVEVGLAPELWVLSGLDEQSTPDPECPEGEGRPLIRPDFVRGDTLLEHGAADTGERPLQLRRQLGPAMQRAGYVVLECGVRSDKRWNIKGKPTVIYMRKGAVLPPAKELLGILEALKEPKFR